jgi:U6 snRNA-associated Sm-like protein LSm6
MRSQYLISKYLTRSQLRPPGKQRLNPTLSLIRQQGTSLVFLNHIDPIAGVLACLDGYMNIAMEQTEEYVNGQLKNKYGDCFIRGNNGESILRPTLVRIFCQGRQVGPLQAGEGSAVVNICCASELPSGSGKAFGGVGLTLCSALYLLIV